ncbi:MAG: polysaccharide deacetylase family protein [Candidatus Krumholzibacteriota bacterium]
MRISLWISILTAVVITAPASTLGEVPSQVVPSHAVALIYHHVDTGTPASTSLSPELFGEHLDYLVSNGYRALPLAALVDSLRNGGTVPDRTVAFTFDDGYRSVYTEAFPRLRELDWPFTVFICPDAVDHGRGPVLTWDQLREMADAGATVANHGMFHHHLQRRGAGEADQAWRDRIRGELLAAQERISREMGIAPALFAYPYGEFDEDLREIIRDLGWAAFGQQSGPMGNESDFTRLPRFPMAGPFAAMETFGDKVGSLPLPVMAASPASPHIALAAGPEDRKPNLRLTLGAGDYRSGQVAAFASGQGAAELTWVDREAGILEVRARQALPTGRSRYNITAPATDGRRYYWYSHTWIVGQAHKD